MANSFHSEAARKKRLARSKKKASAIHRSGKAKQRAKDLSSGTLEQVVQDAQGTSSQKDRRTAADATSELARRGNKPKKKKKK